MAYVVKRGNRILGTFKGPEEAAHWAHHHLKDDDDSWSILHLKDAHPDPFGDAMHKGLYIVVAAGACISIFQTACAWLPIGPLPAFGLAAAAIFVLINPP